VQPTRKPHFYKQGGTWFCRCGAWLLYGRTPEEAYEMLQYSTQWRKRYA
jgi:hypothetical protein